MFKFIKKINAPRNNESTPNSGQNVESSGNQQSMTRQIITKIDIFHSLPHWKKICYCIDLKLGCYFVCVVYVLFIGEACSGKIYYTKRSNQCFNLGPIMEYLGYIAIGIVVITFFACLFLLYGISSENPAAVLFFLYATLLIIIFNMVTNGFLLFIETTYICYAPFLFGGATYSGAILLVLCIMVVNSYYRSILNK
ncbi:unnamed protein product [Chrysodeixis includens]|uniref:Uncharacterized protein n=1 Tax=Chrysodeixis includens TaxID=689277 RepID=A0A9P0BHX6_CHRIL|nr:unnamed protein product [Chrysodeixis includens]